MFVLFAILACLSYAYGGSIFTKFSRQISPLWMNVFKLLVGLICFFFASLIKQGGTLFYPGHEVFVILFVSGLVGLFCGDLFLLMGFERIGSARAMMIYTFQPVFVGLWSYFALGQHLSPQQMLAVLFLLLCMFSMSYEHFLAEGSWELKGLLFSIFGVLLDGVGIIGTRMAFDRSPSMGTFEANLYRGIGAFVGFLLIKLAWRRKVVGEYLQLPGRDRFMVIFASVLGVFVALAFWLQAVSMGTLAVVTALGGSTPLFASIFEHILEKKRPSKLFFLSFFFFLVGFVLVIS